MSINVSNICCKGIHIIIYTRIKIQLSRFRSHKLIILVYIAPYFFHFLSLLMHFIVVDASLRQPQSKSKHERVQRGRSTYYRMHFIVGEASPLCPSQRSSRRCSALAAPFSPVIILLEGQSGDASPTKKCCNHFDAFAQARRCAECATYVKDLRGICQRLV